MAAETAPYLGLSDMAQAHSRSMPAASQRSGRTSASARRRTKKAQAPRGKLSQAARRCRAKFRHYFPKGFYDPLYEDWERGYKWDAHRRWAATLDRANFLKLLMAGRHNEIAARAVAIEARTNLLFSFEKMALRDAVKPAAGARAFAHGLYDFLHGPADMETRFNRWCDVVAKLPRRQTRSPYLACRDSRGVHCATADAHLPQADRDAKGRPSVRHPPPLPVAALMGDLCKPALGGPRGTTGSPRDAAAGHDRHTIVPVGSGLRGVPGLNPARETYDLKTRGPRLSEMQKFIRRALGLPGCAPARVGNRFRCPSRAICLAACYNYYNLHVRVLLGPG